MGALEDVEIWKESMIGEHCRKQKDQQTMHPLKHKTDSEIRGTHACALCSDIGLLVGVRLLVCHAKRTVFRHSLTTIAVLLPPSPHVSSFFVLLLRFEYGRLPRCFALGKQKQALRGQQVDEAA